MKEKLRYKDKLTSEMGENPNETIMNISTKTSEMGENPNETIMNISTKTSEMGENPNETIMNPQTNKPFDIILNEEFGKYQTKGYNKNWFVPIVKEQSDMDLLNEIRNDEYPHWRMERNFPKILLEVVKDEDKNIISIYTLYSKGGKLYRVVSQKDYGVIKSRMELINGEYVPYEKCDLVPFDGKVDEYDEYDDNLLKKSFSYKNGVKDGECFTYYVDGQTIRNEETNEWEKYHYYEKTTYKNGKKDGEFENTKYGLKGNYINNKKNGVWVDSYRNIYSNLKSSYQSKFDLSEYDLENFIKRNFEIIDKYDVKDLNDNGVVFYVNDVLNGEFKIKGWEGKFELGLPNGVMTNVGRDRWKSVINSKLFENGIIVNNIKYDSGDREEYEEETYSVESYENGFKKSLIELSSNLFEKIPSELTYKTNRFLIEDVFYTIVKNEFNKFSLERFLELFVVLSKIDYETDIYDRTKVVDRIEIKTQKLDYGIRNYSYRGLTNYLIEECGYPYFEEIGNFNPKNYKILESEEYNRYSYYYHPKVYSLSESGEVTKLFINGELIDETIDNETNPIVLEFQKEVFQNLSNEMKSSYEREIHKKQIEEIEKNNQLEIEREVKGFSINSFPLD